jgi:hypothetical protein
MFGALLPLLLVLPSTEHSHSLTARQRVDLIELHHSYDEVGRHVFDQLVFYEWSRNRGTYRVIAWRMVKRKAQLPQRTWQPRGHRCLWQDDGVLREIWAPLFRETWSQHDPERANRRIFPEAGRPELTHPPAVIHRLKVR